MGNKLLRFIESLPSFALAVICIAALLSACGGGGGGGASTATGASGAGGASGGTPFAPSITLANLCASPRPGTADRPGSMAQEKSYLRSFIDETYLWYRDVPNLDANRYPTPQAYFEDLKTWARTPSNKDVDRFHWSQPTASWDAASAGDANDYGIVWATQAYLPPRNVVVAEVVPGTPAALAGIQRGDQVTFVDGVDVVNDATDAGIAKFLEGLFPTVTTRHQLAFKFKPTVTLTTASYSVDTVQKVQTIATPSGNVGYFIFDAHLAKSEAELVAAINQLKASHVSDLVIDMRYNGGGLLYIASDLAYMVAGPSITAGKAFEKLIYNDKLTAENWTMGFRTLDNSGQLLPHLDLRHVTLLVTQDTASASESVVNSLRGVDVRVDLVGSTTLGKPYGFVPQDNCGTTYFAIQFKGINEKNFGEYTDGFAPTCGVKDDFFHSRGDTSEGMLRTALDYRQTGVCSVSSANAIASSGANARALLADSSPPFSLMRRFPQGLRIVADRARP